MASISTFSDDFNGGSIDPAKWDNDAAATVTGGALRIDHTGTAGDYVSVWSHWATTYDYAGQRAFVQIVDFGNQSYASHDVLYFAKVDNSNNIWITASNGNLFAMKQVAGVSTQVGSTITLDQTAHRWWSIRESGGTLYYCTSPDGVTWTDRWSLANPFGTTMFYPQFVSGNWDNEAGGSYAVFDNFNTRMGLILLGSNVANATSVTIPVHDVGDLIVIYAHSSGGTSPSVPSAAGTVPAWTTIDTQSGSFSNLRTAQCIATANNHTSGTWTGADAMIAVVLRNVNSSTPIGGHAVSVESATGNTCPGAAVTMSDTTGSSVLLQFYGWGDGVNSVTSISAAPGGYTQQIAGVYTGSKVAVCLNTKDSTTSDGAVAQTSVTGTWSRGATVEILVAPRVDHTADASLVVTATRTVILGKPSGFVTPTRTPFLLAAVAADATLAVTATPTADGTVPHGNDQTMDSSLVVTASQLDQPVVTYDATGAGANSGAGTTTSLSWTHTATAGADVFAFVLRGGSTVTATYDGAAMSYVGAISLNNTDGNGSLFVFRKANVAGGTKTVAVTFSGGTYTSANSVSYLNVGTITLSSAYAGAALTATQSITGADKNVILNASGQYCGGVDTFVSSSGGTQRYQGMGSAKYMNLVIQDSTSTGSVAFSSTVTATNTVSGSIGLLLGPPTTTSAKVKTVELLSTVSTPTQTAAYSYTWNHTIESNATLLVVAVEWLSQSWNANCTVNGLAMTRVGGTAYANSGWVGVVEFFYYVNPPTGTQTLLYNGGGWGAYLSATSCTFANAKTVGTCTQSANTSLTVSGGGPNDFILNVIGGWVNGFGGFTGYNQTLISADLTTVSEPGLFGYARGSSATFSVANLLANYGGYGIGALPIKPVVDHVADASLTVTASPTTTLAVNSVTYESTGAGASANGGTITWNHTIGATANCVIVGLTTNTTPYQLPTVKVGSSTYLKCLGINLFDTPGGNNTFSMIFGMMNPPTGTQTFTVTGQTNFTSANSVAYNNVSGFDAPVYSNGTGSSITLTNCPGVDAGMVVQTFGSHGPSVLTNYNWWSHYNFRDGNTYPLLIGDAPGGVGASFSATNSDTGKWGGIGISLLPVASAPPVIQYDAMGTSSSMTGYASVSFSHVATANAFVILDICVDRDETITAVTYAGQSMTLQGSVRFTGYGGNAGIWRYTLPNVPGGLSTVSATLSANAYFSAQTISYTGVSSIAAPTTTSGTSSAPSQAVTCTAGKVIVESIGVYAHVLTSPLAGGTNLFAFSNSSISLDINQATASSTFTTSDTAVNWGAIASVLSGLTFTADSTLAITASPTGTASTGRFANATLAITETPAGGAVRNAMVDSTLAVTASRTSNVTWALAADVVQTITATMASIGSYGAVAAVVQTITTTTTSTVKWALKANVTQQLTAAQIADTLRNAIVNVAIPITASPTANVIWDLKANVTEAITATPLAAEERTAMVDATMPITAGMLGLGTITYDSTGVGATGSSSTGFTLTWNHTIGATANYVVMAISHLTNGTNTYTAKCGGVTMTLLGSTPSFETSPGPYSTFVYGLANPPTGTQSMTFQTSANYNYVAGNSVSYSGVGSVAAAYAQRLPATTAVTMTVPSLSNQRLVNAWASGAGTGTTMTGYSQTLRSLQPEADNVNAILVIGDAAGTDNPVTFSGTSTVTGKWGGAVIALTPLGPTAVAGLHGDVTEVITSTATSAALRTAQVNATQQITASRTGTMIVGIRGNATIPITALSSGTVSYGATANVTMPITATRTAVFSYGATADALQALTATRTANFPTWAATSSMLITALLPAISADWTGEENTNRTDIPTPTGLLGILVTVIGGGAAGKAGIIATAPGWGGGGGARIDRTWIPAESLGPTISMTWGTGGATSSANGNDSVFSSGSIMLTAGGGQANVGGTATVSGITTTSHDGAGSNTSELVGDAGAGGGSGGSWSGTSPLNGNYGGASVTVTTQVRNGASPADATVGHGGAGGGGGIGSYSGQAGAGGHGGLYGGGGGGGGISPSTRGLGGAGGDGYTQIIYIWRQGATADTDQIITAAPTSKVNWAAKGNVTQAITASPIAIGSLGQAAASVQQITATPDGTGSRGQVVDADETITALLDAIGSLGQDIDSDQIITVSPSGIITWHGLFDASQTITTDYTANATWALGADATQAITASLLAGGFYGAVGNAPLIVTTDLSSNVTWDTTGNADQIITAGLPVIGSLGQIIDSDQIITALLTGVGSRGQVVSASQVITASFTGLASYGATGNVQMPITATQADISFLQHNHAYSRLIVTAGRSANVTWNTTANVNLIVTTTRTSAFGRLLNVDAALALTTNFTANAKAAFRFNAAQQITASPTSRFGRGQVFGAAQAITATPIGGIVWHGRIGAPLQITATLPGNAIWDVHANTGLLIVSSAPSEIIRGQSFDAPLAVAVSTDTWATQTMSADVVAAIEAIPDTALSLGSTFDAALPLIVTYSASIEDALNSSFFYFYL